MAKFPPPSALRDASAARPRAFLLLEVILSLVILGLAAMVLLRAYTLGRTSVRKAEIITVATMLADGLVETLDMTADLSKLPRSGDFGDTFPGYSWDMRVEEKRLRYDHQKGISGVEDLEPLRSIRLSITYRRGASEEYRPLSFTYHPLRIEPFSQRAKFENQIYGEGRE
jgi:general secretion pathway protein I